MTDNGFIFDTEFSTDDFSFDDISFDMETKYLKAKKTPEIKESCLYFENAIECAKNIDLNKGARNYILISGNFIFGDLIEALAVKYNLLIKKMTLSTLSYSENNIDSLVNLFDGNYLLSLDMIISDYFYSHERHNLIKYAYKKLDKNSRFQLSVASCHTKVCLIETEKSKIVIHGSANLRSSNCMEQIVVEENEALFDFNKEFHDKITEKYKTINKAVRNKELNKTIKN